MLRQRMRRAVMTGDSYRVVAGVIREIEDPALRKTVADLFATAFNRRSKSFDPGEWERWTGGRPAPDSAKA